MPAITSKDLQTLRDGLEYLAARYRSKLSTLVERSVKPLEQQRLGQIKKDLGDLYGTR